MGTHRSTLRSSVHGIRDLDRPAGIFIGFHQGSEYIEAIALRGANGGPPQAFDLGQSCSMILLGTDGVDILGDLLSS